MKKQKPEPKKKTDLITYSAICLVVGFSLMYVNLGSALTKVIGTLAFLIGLFLLYVIAKPAIDDIIKRIKPKKEEDKDKENKK